VAGNSPFAGVIGVRRAVGVHLPVVLLNIRVAAVFRRLAPDRASAAPADNRHTRRRDLLRLCRGLLRRDAAPRDLFAAARRRLA